LGRGILSKSGQESRNISLVSAVFYHLLPTQGRLSILFGLEAEKDLAGFLDKAF